MSYVDLREMTETRRGCSDPAGSEPQLSRTGMEGRGDPCCLGTIPCYCLLSRGGSWATCSIVVSEKLEATKSGVIRPPRLFLALLY